MLVRAVAPNFAESFQAGALGASGVQSQGLLGTEPEKLRYGDAPRLGGREADPSR